MSEIKHIKLSELAKQIKDVINQTFGVNTFWIVAEISGLKSYNNQNRHYFDFVEKSESSNEPLAKISGVAWREGSANIEIFENETGQRFSSGIQVLVKVKVEFHISFGFKLILLEIDKSFTLGNLEKQRQETLEKLLTNNPDSIKKVGEEYITKNKILNLNVVIQRIAIIGSPNSEGYIDFTHTIHNNQFKYKFEVDIYHSSVQGVEAEKELVNKLIAIYNSKKQYDCVVIIRGGGAKTDFLVFDSYTVSRAVARFPIPILTGIGHHKDISIVDLMANTSTKTPTKAAEFIIYHNRKFEEEIILYQKTIIISSQQKLNGCNKKINESNIIILNKSRMLIANHKDDLNKLNQVVINRTKSNIYNLQTNLVSLLNQITSKPKIISNSKLSDLSNISSNLKLFSAKYLTNQKGYLGHYISIIKLMSPDKILKMGFAIVSVKKKIICNFDNISNGDDVNVIMEKSQITVKVISKSNQEYESKFDI